MENSPQIVQKGVRIVSLNCFLIPYLLTFRNTESANSRFNQSERAKRIGSFIASKDLVILQEVWGSQLNVLQQSIQKSHQILPGSESYKDAVYGYQYVSNLLDSVNYWWNRTGGLWCAHRNDLSLVFHARHTFTVSETSSQKGVQAMLVDMNPLWPNKYLLIFNTHLDPRHVENKRKQFQEIHNFMGEVLTKIKESDKNISMANCGVMLMGDFNTKSTTGEYTHLVSLFGMRDLYREHINKTGESEKATFGCGENSLICEPKAHERRIDYIFALDSYKYNENSTMKGEEVKFLPLESEDFEIATQRQGEELSDHWPLLCTVKPKEE